MDRLARVERVRSALRGLKLQEAKAALGPPCSQCVHLIRSKPSDVCGHLVYTKREFDPVSGQFTEKNLHLASGARSDDGSCGPEGLLFEPLPLWKRLFG